MSFIAPAKSCARQITRHALPALVSLCIGALAVMAVDRNLPHEVLWGKVVPPTVLPGQPVVFHFGLKKYAEYGGTVKRWVTDKNGQVYPLADAPVFSDKIDKIGVEKPMERGFVVPCGMPVGDAAYHSTTSVYAWWNLVQRIWPVPHDVTYPFTVIAGRFENVCSLTGDGNSGARGAQGTQGAQGVQGVPGAAAVVVARPRIIHKVWIEPSVIKAGSKFIVHIELTINQVCPGSESHWSIVRMSDGLEVAKVIQPTKPVVLGFNSLSNMRTLPTDIPPGEYYYTSTVYDHCGPDRTLFMATTEHVPLTVEK